MKKPADFKTAYVALMESENSAAEAHPEIDALIAYHRGDELSADEKSRLRDHLLTCRECAAEVGEMEAFARAARGEQEPTDFETVASWHALQRRLGRRPRRFPTALAASLLMTALGVSIWVAAQQREPRPNAVIVDLTEDGSRRPGGIALQEITAPDGGVLLNLTPDVVPAYPAYEIRILDAGGVEIRTVKGLEKHPRDDTFTLFLLPGFLADGDYRVELYGRGGESGEPIASYRIRWADAARSPSE